MLSRIKTILVSTLILVSSLGTVSAQEPQTNAWTPPASYIDAKTGNNHDIVLGDANAPVTIYEYASLTCPHCKAFQELALPEIKKKWIDTGKAKLVYRHYPLDQSALIGALAVQCMPPAQRYETVELLFNTVDRWQTNIEAIVDILKEKKGADFTFESGKEAKQSLIDCLNRPEFAQASLQSMLDASQNGVNSTPYLIIGDEHIRGAQPAEEIGKLIEKQLSKNN
jgi:protein-disulfide isomerase